MAKLVLNMDVEMADDVLGKMAEAMGAFGAEGRGAKKMVMEIKDVGGKMIIRAEPTDEKFVEGNAVSRTKG
jgi:hypothetical protein